MTKTELDTFQVGSVEPFLYELWAKFKEPRHFGIQWYSSLESLKLLFSPSLSSLLHIVSLFFDRIFKNYTAQ